MGFRFSDDGECLICKKHTNKFCDSCGRYICDKHQIEVNVKGSTKTHIYCKECYEKAKAPKNADMRGLHPDYHF